VSKDVPRGPILFENKAFTLGVCLGEPNPNGCQKGGQTIAKLSEEAHCNESNGLGPFLAAIWQQTLCLDTVFNAGAESAEVN
jgi:hypothetical protein